MTVVQIDKPEHANLADSFANSEKSPVFRQYRVPHRLPTVWCKNLEL